MISIVILTKNEEENIVDCLESVVWADEIIIIDDYSTDKTVEIIQNLKLKIQNYKSKIKIYKRHLSGDFAGQRNFGLSKSGKDWILFVDADERISPKLQSEIRYLTAEDGRRIQLNGFYLKRQDFLWDRELKYGETGNIKLLRLAKKERSKWEGKVHEKWIIKGKTGEVERPILHYPHRTITGFLQGINFYTDIRARELFDRKMKIHPWQIITYPIAKFILNFFIKQGFRDRLRGFVFAVFMSLHSFLVRAKLWQLWQEKKQY